MNGKQPKDQPDAQQFARVMLWHLCNIQIKLDDLAAQNITETGEQEGVSPEVILMETANYGKHVRKRAESLYRDALLQANIKPSPQFPYQPPAT